MDKSEWKKVEDALSGTYGSADMKVDGFTISFYRVLISKNRLGITTYINEWVRCEWLNMANDVEGRFLRQVKRHVFSAKNRTGYKALIKILGRKYDDIEKLYEYRTPIWWSVSSIRKYYEKTFKNIKLIKINGEDCG